MLPGNERIHRNGEDYVPAYWLTVGKDALDRALAELSALTAALAAERTLFDDPDLVEELAALSHQQWAGWTNWMVDQWDETHANGETFQERWARQAATPYVDLSEKEKESDRVEARRVLATVFAWRAARGEATDGGE